jgi:hypothetical protein
VGEVRLVVSGEKYIGLRAYFALAFPGLIVFFKEWFNR